MITPASNRLRRERRDRGKPRRDDHEHGLFVVETRAGDDRWTARSTRATARGAKDRAWDLLAREGGEVRVRQGRRVVAEGAAYASPGPTTKVR